MAEAAARSLQYLRREVRYGEKMKSFHRVSLTAVLAASALMATGCSGAGVQAAAGPATAASTAPTAAAQTSSAPAAPTAALPAGIIAKGVANDGVGDYLQTSLADTDPAMQYNPAITDDAAKAHYSAAELADAQKVIVRFMAEEVIDSTLNGGKDIDGWWAAHKDQIHPGNQIMLDAIKADTDGTKPVVIREAWMATKPGYSYLHGATTPRIKSRAITPTKLFYGESATLQGVCLDANASWSMQVTGGSHGGVQSSTATISLTAAKDPADGNKWKIAGWKINYNTTDG
jgi:hypothetical protein